MALIIIQFTKKCPFCIADKSFETKSFKRHYVNDKIFQKSSHHHYMPIQTFAAAALIQNFAACS